MIPRDLVFQTEQFVKQAMYAQSAIHFSNLKFVQNHLTVEVIADDLRRELHLLTLRLKTLIVTRKREEYHTVASYPENWWEALRHRWFPQWWLKRHPVKWTEIKTLVTVWHTCPHLDVPPTDTRHLEFLISTPTPT